MVHPLLAAGVGYAIGKSGSNSGGYNTSMQPDGADVVRAQVAEVLGEFVKAMRTVSFSAGYADGSGDPVDVDDDYYRGFRDGVPRWRIKPPT
jgi:hypothetical protein